MKKQHLQRLIKTEEKIIQLYTEKYNLKVNPVEFDIVPAQKMLEIMAYRIPTNISNWKYGRDFERLRTIFDNIDPGLPYEVVINGNPPRAYLMNTNPFAVQVLVIAHVYGHENFYVDNKWYSAGRSDLMNFMHEASQRFMKYERRYGKDFVEMVVDAGHALQLHSSPFDNETEDEKRERIFEQIRLKNSPQKSEYGDILKSKSEKEETEDIALRNQRIWRDLKLKTPVEPTEDLLRYLIDNSRILEDWQKDILEALRTEGRHFWPFMKTRYMNEGYATYIHEKVCKDLFDEGYLTQEEHGQYNYSNSLVKAMIKGQMNPYLIGSEIWKDIEERWDKGRHGYEYDNCQSIKEKENWDTKDMKGWDKIQEIKASYTDWFFMQDFLTPELVDKTNLYIFKFRETMTTIDVVRTRHTAKQIRDLIVRSFSHTLIPKIEIIDGNYKGKNSLLLQHKHTGADLDVKYAIETMKHIYNIWGYPVMLLSKIDEEDVMYEVHEKNIKTPKKKKRPPRYGAPWTTNFGDLIINDID